MTAKTDMERIGLFKELGYVSVGDKYVPMASHAFNESAGTGRQMLGPHSKNKSAHQDGYFEKKFVRIFEGESFTDAIKRRRQMRMEGLKSNVTTKAFLPSHADIDICSPGNYYGSFSGVIDAFAPSLKVLKNPQTSLKNVQTNPGKRGTGYGYKDICIGPYPEYLSEPFSRPTEIYMRDFTQHQAKMKGGAFRLNMHPQAYFDKSPYTPSDKALPLKKHKDDKRAKFEKPFRYSSPGKFMAGDKSGTFDKYPSHSVDVYKPILMHRPVNVVNKTGKLFIPNAFEKTRPVNSVMTQNIMKEMNCKNYRKYTGMSATI